MKESGGLIPPSKWTIGGRGDNKRSASIRKVVMEKEKGKRKHFCIYNPQTTLIRGN